MATKAFQKIYTRVEAITKATISLRASGVANEELATVAGRLAQVVKIKDDLITLQVFEGTDGNFYNVTDESVYMICNTLSRLVL